MPNTMISSLSKKKIFVGHATLTNQLAQSTVKFVISVFLYLIIIVHGLRIVLEKIILTIFSDLFFTIF